MKTGKIIRVAKNTDGSSKGFGYVKASDDGAETFIHQSTYPKGMNLTEGDEISYDIENGDRGPRATSVTVLNRGTPKPSPTPATPPSSEIEMAWSFGIPTSHKQRSKVLPLTLTLTSAKQPRAGIEVKQLKANGAIMKNPSPNPSSDGQGKVHFIVPLNSDSALYSFLATISIGGKEKNYTAVWEKRETAKPAVELKFPEIEVVNPPRDLDVTTGKFLVNVVTRIDDQKADRTFTAFGDRTVSIEQNLPDGMKVVSTFTSDTPGHYPLYLDFDGAMAKVIFKLDNGKQAVVWLAK